MHAAAGPRRCVLPGPAVPDGRPTNGWRSGRDPVQRRLRIVSTVVCLAVFAYLAVDPDRHLDVVPTLGIVVAALFLLLGYEQLVGLPFSVRRRTDDDEDEA